MTVAPSAIRVDQYCTYTYGGAANAAKILHRGLRQLGVNSQFRHSGDESCKVDDPSFEQAKFDDRKSHPLIRPLVKKIKRMRHHRARQDYRKHLESRPKGYELFSAAHLFEGTPLDADGLECDVIHLHWIAFLVDYSSFFASIPLRKPIVWTMHDMNPFTGGCHYSSGCTRYTSGCGECPQVGQSGPDDVSRSAYRIKAKAYRRRNMTVVTPSRWLSKEAQRSLVFAPNTEFRVINLGLDTQHFTPIPKQDARRRLGIEDDRLIIGFGAEDINNQRKGMRYLMEALELISPQRQPIALMFGAGELPKRPDPIGDIHSLGYLKDPVKQVLSYAAADVFVMPSLEDNQPQTGLEALACGTPVVAFDAGGIPEYVRSGITGLTASTRDSADLARQITWMLDHDDARHQWGQQGREMIEREFPMSLQAERYMNLYQELLEPARRAAA